MTSTTYTQGVYVINMGSEWTYDLGKLLIFGCAVYLSIYLCLIMYELASVATWPSHDMCNQTQRSLGAFDILGELLNSKLLENVFRSM